MALSKKQEEMLSIGQAKGLVKIHKRKIVYSHQQISSDFSLEQQVLASTYVELIEKYQYLPELIALGVNVLTKGQKLHADIIVYKDNDNTKPFIVVEVKSSSNDENVATSTRNGLEISNLLLADYLLLVFGEEKHVYHVKDQPKLLDLAKYRRSALPVGYGAELRFRYTKGGDVFSELTKTDLNELHNKFQRCHDLIWEGGKRDPAEAFDEMSKLMFAKIFDERYTEFGKPYQFQIESNVPSFIVARRIKEIYKRAQEKEPGVFNDDIGVSDNIIIGVVEILQNISLTTTDLDSKGRAFEKFLGRIFRGELGQFFTPREVIDFMVGFINPEFEDLIIDPACGSGGFLLYSIKKVTNDVFQKFSGDSRVIERIIWDFTHFNVFGIDVNNRIARIAMMDMVIHDDGHTNIECNDALSDYKCFDPRRDIHNGKYDVVLTNPPFGAVEKNPEILKLYELGAKFQRRNSQRKEILFIERCIDLLKIGGRMGIVLPDGILTNSSLKYVRDFIKRKTKIMSVISLPEYTFRPFGSGVKASILFLEKKATEDEQEYQIFMGISENVGYDATGREQLSDLPQILAEWRRLKSGKSE